MKYARLFKVKYVVFFVLISFILSINLQLVCAEDTERQFDFKVNNIVELAKKKKALEEKQRLKEKKQKEELAINEAKELKEKKEKEELEEKKQKEELSINEARELKQRNEKEELEAKKQKEELAINEERELKQRKEKEALEAKKQKEELAINEARELKQRKEKEALEAKKQKEELAINEAKELKEKKERERLAIKQQKEEANNEVVPEIKEKKEKKMKFKEVKLITKQEKEAKFSEMFIYKDAGYVENKYIPTGWMGDTGDLRMSSRCFLEPKSGTTCMKIGYSARQSQGNGWAGIYWQNPANNWGTEKKGFDLTGAKKLRFYIKGEKGGEIIDSLKVGGITGTYPDTADVPFGPIILTKKWVKYEIDLRDRDLSHIIGGFCFVVTAESNPQSITFYLDEIVFE